MDRIDGALMCGGDVGWEMATDGNWVSAPMVPNFAGLARAVHASSTPAGRFDVLGDS